MLTAGMKRLHPILLLLTIVGLSSMLWLTF
jgi:hypothetical protein